MVSAEELYSMKLHDVLSLDEYTNVIRVAGGWCYAECITDSDKSLSSITSTFVPLHNEFNPKPSIKHVGDQIDKTNSELLDLKEDAEREESKV